MPAPIPIPIIDLCTLADFALANLSSVESLKVEGELKRDPHAIRNLEFILKLIAHCENEINSHDSAPTRTP